MADPALPQKSLRLDALATGQPTEFELVADAAQRAAIAAALNIRGVRKLRFAGELAPMGRKDWTLTGSLGATVVQDCVVTLEPVVTRIDEDVSRAYLANFDTPEAEEMEMPEDVTSEPLPATLDLWSVAIEALSLALPPFPRSEGAELGEAVYTQPGEAPMRDEDARPFAGLAGLKQSLQKKDGDED